MTSPKHLTGQAGHGNPDFQSTFPNPASTWHLEHSLYPSDDGSSSSDSGRLVKILTGEPFFPAPPPDLKERWLTYSTWVEI